MHICTCMLCHWAPGHSQDRHHHLPGGRLLIPGRDCFFFCLGGGDILLFGSLHLGLPPKILCMYSVENQLTPCWRPWPLWCWLAPPSSMLCISCINSLIITLGAIDPLVNTQVPLLGETQTLNALGSQLRLARILITLDIKPLTGNWSYPLELFVFLQCNLLKSVFHALLMLPASPYWKHFSTTWNQAEKVSLMIIALGVPNNPYARIGARVLHLPGAGIPDAARPLDSTAWIMSVVAPQPWWPQREDE